MLKQLSLCAALLVLGSAGINAQQLQQDTVLQKLEIPGAAFGTTTRQTLARAAESRIEVPGADFDLVVTTTGSPTGAAIASGEQKDPLDAGLWPTRVDLVPRAGTVGSAAE